MAGCRSGGASVCDAVAVWRMPLSLEVSGSSDAPTFSGAVPADQLCSVGEAAAVMDQEATGAGELVGLLGDDADGEFFTGQVGAGQ